MWLLVLSRTCSWSKYNSGSTLVCWYFPFSRFCFPIHSLWIIQNWLTENKFSYITFEFSFNYDFIMRHRLCSGLQFTQSNHTFKTYMFVRLIIMFSEMYVRKFQWVVYWNNSHFPMCLSINLDVFANTTTLAQNSSGKV